MNRYNPNIHHRRSIRLKGYDYTQAGLYFITICVKDRLCLFGNIVRMNQHVGADQRVCPDIRTNAEMVLNDAGKMVEKWYYELENKFPDIRCHEMVVMPNHFHCIIENIGTVGADLRVCPIANNANTNNANTNNANTNNVNANNANTNNANANNVNANNVNTNNVNTNNANTNNANTNNVNTNNANTNNANANNVNANNVNANNANANNVNANNANANNVNANNVNANNANANTNPIEGEHVGSPLHRVVQWFKTMSTNEYIRGVKTLGWQPFDGKLWQRNYYEHIIRNEKSYHTISEYIINNPAKWTDDKLYAE